MTAGTSASRGRCRGPSRRCTCRCRSQRGSRRCPSCRGDRRPRRRSPACRRRAACCRRRRGRSRRRRRPSSPPPPDAWSVAALSPMRMSLPCLPPFSLSPAPPSRRPLLGVAVADHHVVAGEAGDLVVATAGGGAVQDGRVADAEVVLLVEAHEVVAVAGGLVEERASPITTSLPCAVRIVSLPVPLAFPCVGEGVADHVIVARAGLDLVVSGAAGVAPLRHVVVADEEVVARRADDEVLSGRSVRVDRVADDDVVAVVAGDLVVARAALDDVVAAAGADEVVAAAAVDRVVAAGAVDDVRSRGRRRACPARRRPEG